MTPTFLSHWNLVSRRLHRHQTLNLNDDGTASTVTYVLEAENDLTASTYLEGLAVRPEQHFKGSVFATVKFEATREVGTGDSVVEIPPPWTGPPGI